VSDVFERIARLAKRIRAEMQAGSTLDASVRKLRSESHGAVEVIAAVRELGNMQLTTAKQIVSSMCEGQSFEHLSLVDIDLLGDTPRAGVDFFVSRHRDEAIIDRKPWLLYARKSNLAVHVITSAVPLAVFPAPLRDGQYGSISGASVSFESVTAKARAAAAAWPNEIAIERDEPDELLLRFLRAPTA
jgi:hypothetical protein